MQKFKFRAWDLTTQLMIYFDSVWRNCKPYTKHCVFLQHKNKRQYHDVIVMQFIGTQDKNNQDIYEDDILKAPDGTLYRVFYHDTRAMFMLEPLEDKESKYVEPWDDWSLYKKVGNVYENKEYQRKY